MSNTVKVRIAVAVDDCGNYVAYSDGWKKSWEDCMELMLDDLNPGEARYWVEAELPLPDANIIAGEHRAVRDGE